MGLEGFARCRSGVSFQVTVSVMKRGSVGRWGKVPLIVPSGSTTTFASIGNVSQSQPSALVSVETIVPSHAMVASKVGGLRDFLGHEWLARSSTAWQGRMLPMPVPATAPVRELL
jgi:hypothetical protein